MRAPPSAGLVAEPALPAACSASERAEMAFGCVIRDEPSECTRRRSRTEGLAESQANRQRGEGRRARSLQAGCGRNDRKGRHFRLARQCTDAAVVRPARGQLSLLFNASGAPGVRPGIASGVAQIEAVSARILDYVAGARHQVPALADAGSRREQRGDAPDGQGPQGSGHRSGSSRSVGTEGKRVHVDNESHFLLPTPKCQ